MLGGLFQSLIFCFSLLFLVFTLAQKLPLFFHPALGFGILGWVAAKFSVFAAFHSALDWFSVFGQPWLWALILFFYGRTLALQTVPHLRKNILKSFIFYTLSAVLLLPLSLWGVQWLLAQYLPLAALSRPLLSHKELIFMGLLSLPVAHALYLRPGAQVLGPVATQLKYLTLLSEVVFLIGFVGYAAFQNLAGWALLQQILYTALLLGLLALLQKFDRNDFAEWGSVILILALAEFLKMPLPLMGLLGGVLLANTSGRMVHNTEGILFMEALLLFLLGFKLNWQLPDLALLTVFVAVLLVLKMVLIFVAFKLAGVSRTLQWHGSLGWLYFSGVSLLPLFWLQGVPDFNLSVFAEFLALALLITQLLSWVLLRWNFRTAGEWVPSKKI